MSTLADNTPPDPDADAYEAYILHVAPNEGPKCVRCSVADSPYDGCDEGRRLWGDYRLMKIRRNISTAR
jgi:hypothetical protein